MLGGLDQSAFEDEFTFETGLKLLRDENFKGDLIDDDSLLKALMDRKMTSEFMQWQNQGYYLPAFYKLYCRELEARMKTMPELDWTA